MKWIFGFVAALMISFPALGEDAKCLNLADLVQTLRADRRGKSQVVEVTVLDGKDLPDAWVRKHGPDVLKDALIANWIKSNPPVAITQNGCKSLKHGEIDFVIHASTLNELEIGLDVKKMVARLKVSTKAQLAELEKPFNVKIKPGEKVDDFIDRAAIAATERALAKLVVEATLEVLEKDSKKIEDQLDSYRMRVQREGDQALKVTQTNSYGSEEAGVYRIETVTMVRWGEKQPEDRFSASAERFIKLARQPKE